MKTSTTLINYNQQKLDEFIKSNFSILYYVQDENEAQEIEEMNNNHLTTIKTKVVDENDICDVGDCEILYKDKTTHEEHEYYLIVNNDDPDDFDVVTEHYYNCVLQSTGYSILLSMSDIFLYTCCDENIDDLIIERQTQQQD